LKKVVDISKSHVYNSKCGKQLLQDRT